MKLGTWFKRIRLALRLTKHDVVEIMRLGGMEISSSRADGWQRHSKDSGRATTITEQEVDAFTNGLVLWAKQRRENPPKNG